MLFGQAVALVVWMVALVGGHDDKAWQEVIADWNRVRVEARCGPEVRLLKLGDMLEYADVREFLACAERADVLTERGVNTQPPGLRW